MRHRLDLLLPINEKVRSVQLVADAVLSEQYVRLTHLPPPPPNWRYIASAAGVRLW